MKHNAPSTVTGAVALSIAVIRGIRLFLRRIWSIFGSTSPAKRESFITRGSDVRTNRAITNHAAGVGHEDPALAGKVGAQIPGVFRQDARDYQFSAHSASFWCIAIGYVGEGCLGHDMSPLCLA